MQSRPIPVHLEISNEQEFLAAVSKLASEAEQKLRLGVNLNLGMPSGGGLPPRMEMPSPQQYVGTSYPNQPMKTEAEMRTIRDQNISYASTIRTPQNDSVTQLSRDLNRYTSQLTAMAERGQVGMRVNPARQQMLENKLSGLIAEMESQFNRFTAKNPMDQIAKQSNLINTQIQSELRLPPAQQDVTKIGVLQQQLANLQGLQNTTTSMQEQINRGQSALRASQQIPASSYPTQASLHSQFQTAHGRARTLFGTALPMIAPYLGLRGIGASYSTASGVADAAGAIGMQAGGVNPNNVWHQLNTVGLAKGFSASQMSEAVQQQGQFSGTGNMAFLFRDAQQTAQFARSLGISTTQGAQIMGAYQLSGAFSGGNEALTAQSIAAAAAASGTNAQMFLSGVQQLATAGARGGTFTSGGPATSLSILNQLGNSMGITDFKGSQGATTLGTWQQGLAAGPGGQGGLFSAEMLPIYQSMEKAMAPQYAKIGITNPLQVMMSVLATPIADYPKNMLVPALTAVHKELMSTPASQRGMLEMGVAQNMFGGFGWNALQSVYALGQPGFTKHLDATMQTIQQQKDALQKHATTYQHSIAGKVQQNQAGVQRIADTVGKWAIDAGNAVIPALAAAPALTGGLGLGLDAAATFGGWFGMGSLLRKMGGKGGGAITALTRGAASDTATLAADSGSILPKILPFASDAAKGIPLLGALTTVAGSKLTGHSWGQATAQGAGALIGGALGMLVPVPGLDLLASAGGSALGSWAGGKLYSLFGGGAHPQGAIHAVTAAQKAGGQTGASQAEIGAIQTFAAIAEIGNSAGFQAFVKAFLQNGVIGTSNGSSHGSISLGNPSKGPSISVANGITPSFNMGSSPYTDAAGNPLPASQSQSAFVKQMMPYAQQVSKATGIPSGDILGQWALETGFGTSTAFTQNLNAAGIKPNRQYGPGSDSKYAGYSSLAQFAQNDIQVLKQSNYAQAIHDAKSGKSAYTIGYDLAAGGYATTGPIAYGQGLSTDAATVQRILSQKTRPSAKHNLNRKSKVSQQVMLHQRVGPIIP